MAQPSRALRRHHVARLKKARRYFHGQDLAEHPGRLGKAVHTAAACSCYMCGNPRKYFGERTISELGAQQAELQVDAD